MGRRISKLLGPRRQALWSAGFVPAGERVAGGGRANATPVVDLNTWSRSSAGVLLDPAAGSKGEATENVVRDRISIEGFQDDDEDGVKDDLES